MTAVELYEWATSDGAEADAATKRAVKDMIVSHLVTQLAYELAEALVKETATAAEHWKAKYEGLS